MKRKLLLAIPCIVAPYLFVLWVLEYWDKFVGWSVVICFCGFVTWAALVFGKPRGDGK